MQLISQQTRLLFLLRILAELPTFVDSEYEVRLRELSTIYVPATYNETNQETFVWNSTNVVKVAYDWMYDIIYVTGGSYVHFYEMTNLRNPVKIGQVEDKEGYKFVDVKVCGRDLITLLVNTEVDNIARSLHVTSDCRTIVITTRGEAFGRGKFFQDPPSTVVVLHLPEDMSYITQEVLESMLLVNNFDVLNNRSAELQNSGFRFVLRDHGVPLSADTDAADVTVDERAGKIYVTLQVNNAIAELDLESASLLRVSPLGFKDWRALVMDPSSDRWEISFDNYPIYSYYQPGSIKLLHQDQLRRFAVNKDDYFSRFLPRPENEVYLVTADEGAHRDYRDLLNFTEIITGREMVEEDLQPSTVEPALRADLADIARLGDLKFTKRNGDDKPELNGFRRFVALGGRSFSIWRARDFVRLYDSGDIMETRHAQLYPMLFNCQVGGPAELMADGTDQQSTQKGLEPSVIEVGQVLNVTLLFIGSRHPGTVMVFSVEDDVTKPKFETLWSGIPTNEPYLKWGRAFERRIIAGVDVSDLVFLPGVKRRRNPVLLVAGSVSGTVSFLEVQMRGNIPRSAANTIQVTAGFILIISVLTSVGQV